MRGPQGALAVLIAVTLVAGTGAEAKPRAARPVTLSSAARDSLLAAYAADRADTEKSMRTVSGAASGSSSTA